MNKVFYNDKEIENFDNALGYIITINGKNNKLYLNEFQGPGKIYIYIDGDNCNLKIGKNNIIKNDIGINFWDTATNRPFGSYISIGDNNFFNGTNNSIIAPLSTKIIIGDGNLFAGNIIFWGRNDHIIYDKNTKKRINIDYDIIIGNSNWICQNVSFLPKGAIGNNSVVAYGSIVNKAITKNNVILAGSPIRIKKKHINWSRSSDYEQIDFESNVNILKK